MSRLSSFKAAVRSRDGSIEHMGYLTYGDDRVAHAEAVGLSATVCKTIERELHYVEFDGFTDGYAEFTIDYGRR